MCIKFLLYRFLICTGLFLRRVSKDGRRQCRYSSKCLFHFGVDKLRLNRKARLSHPTPQLAAFCKKSRLPIGPFRCGSAPDWPILIHGTNWCLNLGLLSNLRRTRLHHCHRKGKGQQQPDFCLLTQETERKPCLMSLQGKPKRWFKPLIWRLLVTHI